MTRKASGKKAKRPAKPKPVKAYVAVQTLEDENKSYSEPDRVFLSREAAQAHADRLNREVRELLNPFAGEREAGWLTTGGDRAFAAALKRLGVPSPKPPKSQFYDWEGWWSRVCHELTAEQRDGIWDALDKYEWFAVRETTLED